MQINEYAIEATYVTKLSYFDIDQRLSPGVYQSQKITANNVLGSFLDYLPELLENIYTADGTLTGNREVAQSGFDLAFTGGQVVVGGLSSIFPFRMQISATDAGVDSLNGIYINATNNALFANSSSGSALTGASATGRGCTFFAPSNIVRKNAIGSIPAIDPSSIWDVYSDDQGVRPFPANADPEANITNPADGLMAQNSTINYPAMFHPVYGWQPIGYGEIRLTIDFSVTPLDSGNSWTIQIPSIIPSGKVIHKMVAVGTGVQDPGGGEDYAFGITSDTTYFTTGVAAGLNSSSGSISTGNSNRTVSSNEDIIVSYLGATGTINSGIIELLISHT